MNIKKLYQSKKPVISMEFFPPRNEKAEKKFESLVSSLAKSKPDYMSMTFGAGGSTREGSLSAVEKIMQVKPAVAYLAGYGLGPKEISKVLTSYKALGIKTIFVIRGDKPADDTFKINPNSFSYASEMIDYIKQNYDFIIGCAGYPEGHAEAESIDKDIYYLKQKIDNGAEYIVTQFCYDTNIFFNYVDKCRQAGITVPIIPGIMPVYTLKLTKMLTQICAASIPIEMQTQLNAVDAMDADAVLNLGIDLAVEQCSELLQKDVPGLHFYTMNRSKSTTEIVKQLKAKGALS